MAVWSRVLQRRRSRLWSRGAGLRRPGSDELLLGLNDDALWRDGLPGGCFGVWELVVNQRMVLPAVLLVVFTAIYLFRRSVYRKERTERRIAAVA